MIKLHRSTIRAGAAVALLIALAIVFRNSVRWTGHGPLEAAAAMARSLIYLGLFSAWGISLYKRIIQEQARLYLTAIAVFMVLWVTARTLKYRVFADPLADRICWYFYYVPMLLIPMLGLFAAVAMGKPETYRTPRWMHLLWIPTVLLALIVLTNDFHQLVFRFPPALPWTDQDYSYAPLYWVVVVWIFGSAAVALGMILRKCRVPHSRKLMWLPIVPYALAAAYVVGYLLDLKLLHVIAGDMTIALCVLIAAIFESCIQCGMIQSNAHYGELFRASAIAAQITDADYNVRLSSGGVQPLPAELLRRTASGPVMLPGGIRLSGAPIRGGHVLWREDVSELQAVLDELGDTREELREYARLLEEENKQKQRRRELEEQKRLYEEVRQKTVPTMRRLAGLTRRLRDVTDPAEARALHGRIAVAGAYLKRRSNLVFLADQSGTVAARELQLCLNESLANLRLAGTACALRFELEGAVNGEAAGLMYDFFEAAAEAAWDRLPALNVVVTRRGAGCHILLMLPGGTELPGLAERFPGTETERDDDVLYCGLTAAREAEAE